MQSSGFTLQFCKSHELSYSSSMSYRSKLECSKLNVTGVACVSAVHFLILIAWYEELQNSNDLKIKDIQAKV